MHTMLRLRELVQRVLFFIIFFSDYKSGDGKVTILPMSPAQRLWNSGRTLLSGPRMGTMNFVQVEILQLGAKFAETIESYFYAYRLTGKKIYQDRAWEAFEHITAATISPYGYSAINNVMRREGSKKNSQESFWLAETLKYLFLIFDDPERISLDEWVFNTEAHPLKRERKVDWDNN